MAYERTSVVEIDADRFDMESPSLFWNRTFDERLLRSLEQNGQLVPVLAFLQGDIPCLLAGQRRVRALETLGLPVQTLLIENVSPFERGIVFLESNTTETLDDGAIIRALRYFSSCTDDLTTVASLLGISIRSRQWNLLLGWLDLPESWDDLLAMGHIPLVLSKMLVRFSPEELSMLQEFFRDMSWSKNNAIHFVTWIWEASRMQDCSPSVLMAELGLDAMRALDLSPKDTMVKIIEAARAARYPRLCSQEREFRKRAQDVVAGSKWRLDQPDHFETRVVEFSTRISSRAELHDRVEELAQIARDRVWTDLGSTGEKE